MLQICNLINHSYYAATYTALLLSRGILKIGVSFNAYHQNVTEVAAGDFQLFLLFVDFLHSWTNISRLIPAYNHSQFNSMLLTNNYTFAAINKVCVLDSNIHM